MQCRNCSGNEFRKTASGNYKCVYCGTLYYEESSGRRVRTVDRGKLLLAVSAASAVIVVVALVFILMNAQNGGTGPEKAVSTGQHAYTENGSSFTAEDLPDPRGEVLSIDVIPDIIGNHYFLAICKNTGEVAVRTPHVTVRLYSGNGSKIGSGSGYAFMNDLNPGEVTPVLILIRKPPEYSRFETEYTAELPFVIPENGVFVKRFKGEISDASLKRSGSEHSFRLKGKIRNSGDYGAKFVQVAAVIYNSEGKGIGYGTDYVSEKLLRPGESDFFDIYLTTVAGKPDHYKLYYYGMAQ
ncbi:MAG TPA: FxLYD domain-containing protein [Spirochaetota bacterium]|nr:FxLYD domain-containing protein [Spirochaetota bacterium]HPJ33682.1 FxLYD domain-containing protein [Spirochaetota bacterium]